MARADSQQRWREHAPPSVTLHLTNARAALLDAIAAGIWAERPHDPLNGVVDRIFPGRRAALEHVLDFFVGDLVQVPYEPAIQGLGRDILSAFWRAEAAWRQTTAKSLQRSRATAPTPPWARSIEEARASYRTRLDEAARDGETAVMEGMGAFAQRLSALFPKRSP